MKESKVRREIVQYVAFLDEFFAVKQADFSACKDDVSKAPVLLKWERIMAEMKAEGVPFTLKELAVNGRDVQSVGIPAERTAEVLHALLLSCAEDGTHNRRDRLLAAAARLVSPPRGV